MTKGNIKPLRWVGSSRKDLREFPGEIQDSVGRALLAVQWGRIPESSKPLKGFGGADVREIKASNPDGTFRAVYTLRYEDAVYVLHVFQKKSARGIATPQRHIDLIKSRIREVENAHKTRPA